MSPSSVNKLKYLHSNFTRDLESVVLSQEGPLRIDLKSENIHIWNQTLKCYPKPCNLLIACEHDKG